jgi:hypothetical protein
LQSVIEIDELQTYNGENNVKGCTWSDGTVDERSFGRLSSYPLGNPADTGATAGLMRTLSCGNVAQIGTCG